MPLDQPNLNVGAGVWCWPNAVNLDLADLPGVDVIHDLDVFPWPFDDGRFAEVWAQQVFEHVADPIGFMAEAHRVLQHGGILWMTTPHWQSPNSYTDPTHRRHCTEQTWDYWCPGTDLHAQFGAAYAGSAVYRKESVVLSGGDLLVRLVKEAM